MNMKEKIIGGALIVALLVVLSYEARGISASRKLAGNATASPGPYEAGVTPCGYNALPACTGGLCPGNQKCKVDDTSGQPQCRCVNDSSSSSNQKPCLGFAQKTGGVAYCPSDASCPDMLVKATGLMASAACTVVPGKMRPGYGKTPDTCACQPVSSSTSTSKPRTPACGNAAAPECNGKCDNNFVCTDEKDGTCGCEQPSSPSSPPASPPASSSPYDPPPSSPPHYPTDPTACGNANPSQCGSGACDNGKVCKVYGSTTIDGKTVPACGCFGSSESPPSTSATSY